MSTTTVATTEHLFDVGHQAPVLLLLVPLPIISHQPPAIGKIRGQMWNVASSSSSSRKGTKQGEKLGVQKGGIAATKGRGSAVRRIGKGHH